MPKKTEKGNPLVSTGIVCHEEKKRKKPFLSCSLGQMIPFGTVNFRRTFKNYFGQFAWIEKKQAGTGPSRSHIQGSKIAKDFQVSSTLLQYSKIEIFWKNIFRKNYLLKKMDRVARRGSLARAPGALKSHNAEKLKGGPFEVFQHPFCRKT